MGPAGKAHVMASAVIEDKGQGVPLTVTDVAFKRLVPLIDNATPPPVAGAEVGLIEAMDGGKLVSSTKPTITWGATENCGVLETEPAL